jgi:hypothetical protein
MKQSPTRRMICGSAQATALLIALGCAAEHGPGASAGSFEDGSFEDGSFEDGSFEDGSFEDGGAVGGNTMSPASGGTTNQVTDGAGGSEVAPLSPPPLTARTWRLSHEQYRRSVLDLVGVEPDMENFAPESGNGKFGNFSSTAQVPIDLVANYYDVARDVAWELEGAELASLSSCGLIEICRDTFISELGIKAFRAPVPLEVATRLGALFDLAAEEGELEDGFRAVLAAILNSPLFLYRKEIGSEEDSLAAEFALTSHQVAEFLSYSLLATPPPEWLRQQAEAGQVDETTVSALVLQLIEDPSFDEQLTLFLSEWLEVARFDTVEKSDAYPGFEDAKPLLVAEQEAFFAQSGRAEHGLGNLLVDPVPTVSPELQQFYYSDPSAPTSGERWGALGLGTVLASHAKSYLTSPTLRGTFVRGRFFCQEITLPEGFTPPPLSETEAFGTAQSTRELYEQHRVNVTCASCHDQTDNIGFSMESFDGVGRFRTRDTTQGFDVPINSVAELTSSDVDRLLTGPRDLAQALSESAQVKECFTRQAFRFYFGQVEDEGTLLPAIEQGYAQLIAEDSLVQLTRGLLSTSNTFTRTREVAR